MPAIRMGRWDCPSCGHTNLGPQKHCPNCGKARGRVYLPEGEPAVTDQDKIAEARSGPDWDCAHCSAVNSASALYCTECGAQKGTSPNREVKTYSLEEVPRTAAETEVASQPYLASTSLHSSWEPEKPRKLLPQVNLKSLAMLGLVGMVILGIYLAFFQTHEVKVNVSGFSWTRTVHIEQYRTVNEGDWSVPSRGRQISSETRVHHYVTVLDHYQTRTRSVYDHSESYTCGSRDLGNGYYEDVECSRSVYRDETYQDPVYRQDPVYQTWYFYDIDKWVHERDAAASGNTRDDPPPAWPQFNLAYEGQTVLGAQRESSREEHYYVVFLDTFHNESHIREEEVADWLVYDPNQEYVLILTNFGIITNDPLRPEE